MTMSTRGEHQRPVHLRHVDLAHLARRRVLDVEPRREAELNRLAGDRERAGDQRLRRDDRRRRRQRRPAAAAPTTAPAGRTDARRSGSSSSSAPWPEVVQDQRRQHQREPRQPDRMLAEVAHVRVERFAAGDDEEHGAEHGEAGEAVGDEERDRVPRIERAEHGRRAHDPDDAERRDRDEPDDHDRAEQPADPVCAVLLNHEQPDQDHDGDRHDVRAGTAASTTSRPSTAPSTEIAGVIMPSP